jgi:hypothetical protein
MTDDARPVAATTGASPPSADPERWFEAFAAFSRALAEAVIDLPTLFDVIARQASALFGDATSVRLLAEDGERFEVAAFHAPDPSVEQSLRALSILGPQPAEGSLAAAAMRAGKALLYDIGRAPELRETVPPAYRDVAERVRASSALVAPMIARGRPLGALLLLRTREPAHSPRDLLLGQHVADRAALAIDNARLFLAAQREIAERQRAEAAQRRAEGRLREVVARAPVALFAVDGAGVVRVGEGRALAALGVGQGVAGRPVEEVFAHAPWLVDAFLRAGEGSEVWAMGDLGARAFEVQLHPVRDAGDERASGAVGVAFDVTERRLAEKADAQARELEALERFRLVAENAWDVVYRYRIRPHAGFEYVSASCARQNGYSVEEMYADPELLLRLVHPDDRPRLLDETPTPEAPRRLLVLRNVRRDGSVFWAEQHVRGVFDDHDRLVALEGIVRDVTERVEREAELRRAKEAAEALNHEIEAFSYSVSHDLRAPLRHIDGFSLALLEDYAGVLDDRGKDWLGRVRRGSQRLSELIDALLSLSRLTRKEPIVTTVDLSTIAREVLADLASASPERGVATEVEDGLTARSDERLVRIVLENLIGNAWKFTARTEAARIEVGASSGEGRTRFFVRDNGAGFDPLAAERLFRPFQRLHDEASFPGTGIGLATVRRILRRFGGDAWAEGAPGRGATFWFTLAPR